MTDEKYAIHPTQRAIACVFADRPWLRTWGDCLSHVPDTARYRAGRADRNRDDPALSVCAAIGLTSLALNVPLFIMGYKLLGRVFAFRSLVATILFSLLIDWLPVAAFPTDSLLGAVFGGVLMGVGLGLILRGSATTGGSDLIAKMIHSHFQHVSVGVILFVIDFCVVIAAAILITANAALYALIAIFISARIIDIVVQGFERHKACYIISARHEAIKRKLMDALQRGMTILDAKGGFSNEDRPVLLCIVSAQELARLKLIIRMEDENAFVFISDAHEVLGEGFHPLDKDS